MELFDERSSTKVFYKTLNRESPGEELENVQSDSELGDATTRADQEIVDVILSGRVSTASVLLPCASLPRRVLTSPFQTECQIQPVWEFSGRVRISDGLVVLVRQSVRHRHAVSPSDKLTKGPFHVEKCSTSFDLCRLRCVCYLFRVGGRSERHLPSNSAVLTELCWQMEVLLSWRPVGRYLELMQSRLA